MDRAHQAIFAAENYEIDPVDAPWIVLLFDTWDVMATFARGIAVNSRGRIDDRLKDLEIRLDCLRRGA